MLRVTFVVASVVLVVPTTLQAQSNRWSSAAATRPTPIPLANTPDWLKDYKFKQDKFTFVRIKFNTHEPQNGNRQFRGWMSWATDYPDADLALCSQVEQLTNLKAEPLVLELTNEKLPNYPFIILFEPGRLEFTETEVAALRKYLLNGGFLMVDDFWGDFEYQNFYDEIKRVFPEPQREPQELPITHRIFQAVYPLKEKPQVPSINSAEWGRDQGITWEPGHGGDCQTVHYKGIFDGEGRPDADRMMVIICHNTDLSDGWERTEECKWYSEEFSAKKAFPMGINIVFYALTQ